MKPINDFLKPIKVTDLNLIQTILGEVGLTIGALKEYTESSRGTDDEVGFERIISQITYYDYSIFMTASGDLDIQQEEKQFELNTSLRNDCVMFHFDTYPYTDSANKYRISCACPYHPMYNKENLNNDAIQQFLTSPNTFSIWYPDTDNCIGMSVRFINKDLRGSKQLIIGEQGNSTEYPVLQTIALVIKAASLVKATDYEAFIGPFTKNLTSFNHPKILCTT